MIAIHYECNLNCGHCYEKRLTETISTPLSVDEKKTLIRECLNLGVIAIDFIGGESHLSSEFPLLVKASKPHRTFLSMSTNGYGLTDKKVRTFMKMGIDKLNISVDSGIASEHDNSRGKTGAFRHAMHTISICRRIGMDFSLNLFLYRN